MGDLLNNTNNLINTGSFVSYEQNNKNYLARVKNIKNNKIQIENNVGQELEIPKERLYKLSPPSNGELTLNKLQEICKENSEKINLEEIWQFVNEDYDKLTDFEICVLYFGTPVTLENQYSIRLALINDKIFFKRLKDGFEPRKTKSIEDLKKALLAAQKKKEEKESTINYFYKRIIKKEIEPNCDDIIKENIRLLTEYASNKEGFSNNELKDIKELIQGINTACKYETVNSSPRQAFLILKNASIIQEHTNLFFAKYGYKDDFDNASLIEIDDIKSNVANSLLDTTRKDLTKENLFVFSVDDEKTLDIDDSISIRKNDLGYEVGIHITDLSLFIKKDSLIYKEALQKATSIYLPEGTFNMLPPSISNDVLSLVMGEKRPALSLIVNVNNDFKIIDYKFYRSIINVTKRLTYDELDNILENENNEDFLFLCGFTAECELKRIENNAFSVTRKDVNIYIDENYTVSIKERDFSSPAQNLVGELMILYNNLFAKFASENHISLYYRGQEKSGSISEEILQIKEERVQNYLMRSNIPPSETSIKPIFHSGIGLSEYAQSTSPLRRMMDLINQKQICAFLQQQTPEFSDDELLKNLAIIEESLKVAGTISRETKRYWEILYLKQRKQKGKEEIDAVVLRTDLKYPLVELDEIYFNYVVKSQRELTVGEKVTLKIINANPREDILTLEVI